MKEANSSITLHLRSFGVKLVAGIILLTHIVWSLPSRGFDMS